MNLTQSSLAEFAGDLAARTPVPGGGGASAYAGALAASLASMAAAFTRPKDEPASDDVLDPIVERSRVLSAELVELVEKDAEAYLALSRAYGMSRDDASRAVAVDEACREAADVPLRVMRTAAKVVELVEELEGVCKRMLLSDVGVAGSLAACALESASLSVLANTVSTADAAWARAAERECDELLGEFAPRGRAAFERVSARMRRSA